MSTSLSPLVPVTFIFGNRPARPEQKTRGETAQEMAGLQRYETSAESSSRQGGSGRVKPRFYGLNLKTEVEDHFRERRKILFGQHFDLLTSRVTVNNTSGGPAGDTEHEVDESHVRSIDQKLNHRANCSAFAICIDRHNQDAFDPVWLGRENSSVSTLRSTTSATSNTR